MDGNLRQLFRKNLPQVFWISVETGGTGRGIPDSHGLYKGSSFWIEFKLATHWAVKMRPEQIAWHSRYHRYGGRSFIAIRRNRAGHYDQLIIVPGELAADCINIKKLSMNKVDAWSDGPRSWDWDEIIGVLMK